MNGAAIPALIGLGLVLAGCEAVEQTSLVESRDSIEIARNGLLSRRAALSLVCDATGAVHLRLEARLPIPASLRRTRPSETVGVRVRRDNDAVVFVGGIEQKLPITVRYRVGDRVDDIVSDRLSDGDLARLAEWYGRKAPAKVSVAGIEETSVDLYGKGSGRDISGFAAGCRSSGGPLGL